MVILRKEEKSLFKMQKRFGPVVHSPSDLIRYFASPPSLEGKPDGLLTSAVVRRLALLGVWTFPSTDFGLSQSVGKELGGRRRRSRWQTAA
jgi:hypothetical protein